MNKVDQIRTNPLTTESTCCTKPLTKNADPKAPDPALESKIRVKATCSGMHNSSVTQQAGSNTTSIMMYMYVLE